MSNDTTTVLHVRLKKQAVQKLNAIARADKRTTANYLRLVLEEVARRGGLSTGAVHDSSRT